MSEEAVELLMVGLPESGKSTYVTALFHTLKETVPGGLSLRHLPEEREYLLTLEKRWLALEPIRHSAHVGPKSVVLPIRDASGSSLDLAIPDVNGEEFQDAWEGGGFSDPVRALLSSASGILLFVRANDVEPPDLIDVSRPADEKVAARPTNWLPEMAVIQAKLCDLVEQMSELRNGRLPSLAVVISAWDSVDPMLTPEEWLPWKLPLLWQWLEASQPTVRCRLFGISAQGGDLDDADARARLAKLPRTHRPGGAHELTAPVQWLLETK